MQFKNVKLLFFNRQHSVDAKENCFSARFGLNHEKVTSPLKPQIF